jgi:methyl-accepting chemotaxis protein
MTIGKKIALTCAVLVVLAVISNAVALVSVGRISGNLQSIVGDSLPGVFLSNQVLAHFKDQRIAMLEEMLSTQDEGRARAENTIADTERKAQELLKAYEGTLRTVPDREMYVKIAPIHQSLLAVWSKVQQLDSQKKDQEAFEMWNNELVPAAKAQVRTMNDLVDFNRSKGDVNANAAIQSAATARWLGWLMTAIAVCSGALMAFCGVRNVNTTLHRTVSELADGAEQITSASSQVASSSQSLAQGASEQAASLQETSASSQEITSMTRKNADNSQSAAAMMSEVDRHITEGNRTLGQMVTSMREITTSSDKISKIIKVIDEIAFQTNILALNAAVEAARAIWRNARRKRPRTRRR